LGALQVGPQMIACWQETAALRTLNPGFVRYGCHKQTKRYHGAMSALLPKTDK